MRGSIRKKGRSYEVRVCVGKDLNGRYQYRSRSAPTKKAAETLLTQMLSELQAGTFVDPSKLTLGEYLGRWLEIVKPSIRPSTWATYETLLRVHVVPEIGSIQVQSLRPLHVQELIQKKLANGLGPRSVRHVHGTLRAALNQAIKLGIVGRNVTLSATLPRRQQDEMVTLTHDEARALLDAAHDDRLEALWILALTTGMRQGELLALRWTDIDLSTRTVTVAQAVEWVHGKPILAEPKTKNSRRTIHLSTLAVEALKRHKVRQAEDRLAAGPSWSDLGLAFSNSLGGIIDKNHLARRMFPRLLQKAGVTKITFHGLRHTAATFLLAEGLPVKTVQHVLGHATASMTLDRYGHILPNAERAAAKAMDVLLGKTQKLL